MNKVSVDKVDAPRGVRDKYISNIHTMSQEILNNPYIVFLYTYRDNIYTYINSAPSLMEAVEYTDTFKDDCSIVIYKYENSVEFENMKPFHGFSLVKTCMGKEVRFGYEPRPMNYAFCANNIPLERASWLFKSYMSKAI